MRIYKFKIYPGQPYFVAPAGAKVIHFGTDPEDHLCLWAEVDVQKDAMNHRIAIVGTGFDVPTGFTHKFSCKQDVFIWHLYL